VSGDGRFVAFFSAATNLVPGDTNGVADVYVRDRVTSTTRRVSVSSSGGEANGGQNRRWGLSISADGRYVAFSSSASNLVPADTNGVEDVFVHDMETGRTVRISVRSNEDEAPRISLWPSISADGHYIAFESLARLGRRDHDGRVDVYVRDRRRGVTREASVSSAGVDGNGYSDFPEISADGQTVAFRSSSSNLAAHTPELGPNVFVRDLATRRTSRLHVSGGTWPAAISDHGRFVLFFNYYEVPNGIQLYLRDRRRQTTQRVSFGL